MERDTFPAHDVVADSSAGNRPSSANGNGKSHPAAESKQVSNSSHEDLQHAIKHAAHLLPSQAPLNSFVHHNTLHAFEHLPFEQAVIEGGRIFGCQPYLQEDAYRQFLSRGRIKPNDLQAILEEDLGARGHADVIGLCPRIELRKAMLQHPIQVGPDAELRWFVAHTSALNHFREDVSEVVRQKMVESTRHWVMRDLRAADTDDRLAGDSFERRARSALRSLIEHYGETVIETWSDATWEAFTLRALWRACHQGVHGIERSTRAHQIPVRPRDYLLEATGIDTDGLVHEVLIRFCAAFLDQGFADWPLPDRDAGFYRAFLALYRQPGGPQRAWQTGLQAELDRLAESNIGPLESIQESLALLGIDAEEQLEFIESTLLALRGWAGMIWQTEQEPDRAVIGSPPGSLEQYLAVRLLLERIAIAYVARTELGFRGRLNEVRRAARAEVVRPDNSHIDRRAFLVFQLAQVMGWQPQTLFELSKPQWADLVAEIESFSNLERRRIFHLSYERRFYIRSLDAITNHSGRDSSRQEKPRFQVICCIDEREESFRRHLEETAPDAETFGAAGFFGVAMHYRGATDAHFAALCPIVIKPQHWVQEYVVSTFEDMHRRRTNTRRLLGGAFHQAHVRSRGFFTGALLSAMFGTLAAIPLTARVLFPRLTSRLRRLVSRFVDAPPVTALQLERTNPTPGDSGDGIGFTVEEMAGIVERQLRDIGLTSNFSRLVIVTGHGSSSLNNPHRSAYDCGACSGASGGPNARAYAQMANDPRVRSLVGRRGLEIPPYTWFVGAYHNTCDDSVTYFDLDRLPAGHKAEFEAAKRDIDQARERSAHERCRRFESAPLSLSTEGGLRHVEGRAEDLAQARPECGHATNAITFVGRRTRTRGLFLDRRCFLTSYDPTQDDEATTILARILGAVFPVCSGISLEYYFSYTDPLGYGCSTKLPHNISALIGVMDGVASDLRTGLPWQMVEIHEPVRQLFVIESTPKALLSIMDRNEGIAKLCRNSWIRLAVLDPESSQLQLFRRDHFEPYEPETAELPKARSSIDWYRGWRDHLRYAVIESGIAHHARAED